MRTLSSLATGEIQAPVIIDEAFDLHAKAKAKFDKNGEMKGILGLGKRCKKLLMLAGPRCRQVKDVLISLYGTAAWHEFKSTNFMLNVEDESFCRVVCKGAMEALRDSCAEMINKCAKKAPVIVFGFELHADKLEGEPEFIVKVDTPEALERLHGFSYKREACGTTRHKVLRRYRHPLRC